MKVSKASAYGLHALMYMVRHLTQLPATVETMAQAEGIPTGYLGRILQQLARAGWFVSSPAASEAMSLPGRLRRSA